MRRSHAQFQYTYSLRNPIWKTSSNRIESDSIYRGKAQNYYMQMRLRETHPRVPLRLALWTHPILRMLNAGTFQYARIVQKNPRGLEFSGVSVLGVHEKSLLE